MQRIKLSNCPLCGEPLEGDPSGAVRHCYMGCYEIDLSPVWKDPQKFETNMPELVERYTLHEQRRVIFSGNWMMDQMGEWSYTGGVMIQTATDVWKKVGKLYTERPTSQEIKNLIQDVIDGKLMIMI